MKTGKPTYDELKSKLKELELLADQNRELNLPETSIFAHPEFANFINLSRDGKIICNKEGIIISWNNAIESISGIKAEDAIGKSLWDIKYALAPDSEKKPGLEEKLKQEVLLSFNDPELGPNQTQEFTIKTPGGETRILEANSCIISDLGDVYHLNIIRDISKKKQADLAFKESEERHRGLLNNLEIGILVYTPSGEIILANPKACSMFDMIKDEESNIFQFKVEWEYLDESEELINDETCPIRKILRNRESIQNYLMGCRKKGSIEATWLMVNGFPELNESGEIEEVVISLLDLTDRKKIVEALHIKNVALDSSLLPIGITDLNGNLTYVNPSLVKQWAYDSAKQMLGVSALSFWHEPQKMRLLIEEAYKNGSASGEFIGLKKDKSLFPAACKISTIKDEKNNYLGLVGSFEDLSELKKSQQTLKESEDKFKSIANYSASWEAWFDSNGELLWMNQNSIQLTGFTPEQYMKAPDFLKMCVHPLDLEMVKVKFTEALQGSSGENIEIRANKKDGSFIWISVSWRPIFNSDGNSIGFRTSSQEITDKIIAKHELERSKKQYDNLVANIDVGVFILNDCFNFDYVSPKFSEMIALPINEIMQDSKTVVRLIHPDEWNEFLIKNKEALHQKTLLDWEGKIIVNGEVKWMHVISKPEMQIDGEVLWHGLLIDTTETKKIQVEIASKNAQLLKVIAEKDKFFSIIAHDLRNPFSAFMGLTKIMVDDISDLSREEIHEFAEAMSISANNLHNLLENLLEWSRLQRGVLAFDPKPIFVKTRIEETVKTLKDQAAKKKINVSILVPENLTVHADINMFSAIVRNLLSNAIKFTNTNGSIRINALESNNNITIFISDDGIGMKPDLINKLFKIDEHSNRPGTDGEPSTGLGLILCKDFIEKHGGKIWAESTENVGSTFYFSIPK